MANLPESYGSMVFNDKVMRERLPKDVYTALKRTIDTGRHFDLDVANAVAHAMMEWAVENGATHFTHWFQPMTGVTAEKHDGFLSPLAGGGAILEFSGRELVSGELDASSFPSGGLRSTFEARGYTAWDPTSFAFIKDGSLCIPTAFCSYSGEALDNKTPLLRSMEALEKQAMRILKLFGDTESGRVTPTVGVEQEYFLIDKAVYEKRPDLVYCGRTLFGARPPKGQELEDHYFGAIKPRVSAFMKDLDRELWKLGVPAKTKHNETAPAQHELAPVFEMCNVAADHNQLIMELMKSTAARHGLVCLLHEKPFAGVNGSGKHNNWSLCTDTGVNLLEPGRTPGQNARFLLFLTAVIAAADEYQDLLRVSVAGAGNDHRLGAYEAPPAIVSVFLGEELTDILTALENDAEYNGRTESQVEIGVTVLPHFPRDVTDRNRTSPIAFTGNKFEFRMPGASLSIALPNFILNTAVAEMLLRYADRLEAGSDFKKDLDRLIKTEIRTHKRILYNGNNYTGDWIDEAKRRGLSNLPTTVDALPCLISGKNVALLEKHHVLTHLPSRYEILLENYGKTIHIEALTMIDMVRRAVIPSVVAYQKQLATAAARKQALPSGLGAKLETRVLRELDELGESLLTSLDELENALEAVGDIMSGSTPDRLEAARFYRHTVFARMEALRGAADRMEALTGQAYWAYPVYGEIIYSVV